MTPHNGTSTTPPTLTPAAVAAIEAAGYVTPRDTLLGLDTEIWAERDRKLEEAREVRRKRRELDGSSSNVLRRPHHHRRRPRPQ